MKHRADLGAQGTQIERRDVMFININLSLGRRVEARNEVEYRAFPCTAGSHKCRNLTRQHLKIDVLQDFRGLVIAEVDILKPDLPLQFNVFNTTGGFGWIFVKEGKNPFCPLAGSEECLVLILGLIQGNGE